MKIFEKLRQKLNKELNLNIPDDAIFKRTRSGKYQVSMGAWSWFCMYDGKEQAGSQFAATELLNAEKISLKYNTGHSPEIWVGE